MSASVPIVRQRTFLPIDFKVNGWESLEPYYEQLMGRDLASVSALEVFLRDSSELGAAVAEDQAWRYIRMSCDNRDEGRVKAFQDFIKEIRPKVVSYGDKLNRKVLASPYFSQLDPQKYETFTRALQREVELYREENVALQSEQQSLSQEFGAINGAVTIEHDGKTLTVQQASAYLENPDRAEREAVWRKLSIRRAEDRDKLQELFDKLLALRVTEARNAGYDSYTAYKFDALERFDYTQEDVAAFHHTAETVIRPIFETLMRERRERLGLERLRPWDLSVGMFGDAPLRPFETGQDLVEKSIAALSGLRPEIGQVIHMMDERGNLDLESRPGKSPGGYNYPLLESGLPFVFMNAAGTQKDVTTMLHESGHALHSFLVKDLDLNSFKFMPSEVAELAAMTMELLSLEQYKVFYPEESDRVRAQKEQLYRCLVILPWIATIDAFQAWAYDHPEHSRKERNEKWVELYSRFHGEAVDWTGFEDELDSLWLKQGHIFEVPFYYIEYAIAQLGALAIYRNYCLDAEKGLQAYLDALKLGYTRPIPEMYETAGIRFDFSEGYVKEILEFCLKEYQEL